MYHFTDLTGSSSLVHMGGDSYFKGRGLKSQQWILDGLFHIILLHKLLCLFEIDQRWIKKRPGIAHLCCSSLARLICSQIVSFCKFLFGNICGALPWGFLAGWPDLAKFCHFGEIFKIFGHLVFGNILNLFWQVIYAFGLMLIFVNGQILNI